MEMIETLEYSKNTFPIYGVLDELTVDIRNNETTPFEAHLQFTDTLRKIRSCESLTDLDYGSTAITTAGHGRVPGLDMGSVIDSNTRSARLVTTLLEQKGDVQGKSFILAVDLGKTGWTQSEYMSFWLLSMGVTNPREVAGRGDGAYGLFEKRIVQQLARNNVDLDSMNDAAQERDARAMEYIKFAYAYGEVMSHESHQPESINRLVTLIDGNVSLGGSTERYFARLMKIATYALAAVTDTTVYKATQSLPQLQENLAVIHQHGATIVAPAGATLTIVKN